MIQFNIDKFYWYNDREINIKQKLEYWNQATNINQCRRHILIRIYVDDLIVWIEYKITTA